MKPSLCNSCGGSSFRADRALAGRLVCNKCGTPFDSNRKFNNRLNRKKIRGKYLSLYLGLALIVFLLIIII